MSPHSTSTSPSTVLSPNPAVANTAVVLIDVYNDFLHPDGKLYSLLSTTLAEHDTIAHLREVVACARKHHIPIYYGLHQQWTPDFFDGWNHMAAIHHTQAQSQAFAADTFGSQILSGLEPSAANGDVTVSKHWNSSSFQSTDLDFQLRQRDVSRVVMAGLTANTCLESTSRYAYELGYEVTMLKDATAGFAKDQME